MWRYHCARVNNRIFLSVALRFADDKRRLAHLSPNACPYLLPLWRHLCNICRFKTATTWYILTRGRASSIPTRTNLFILFSPLSRRAHLNDGVNNSVASPTATFWWRRRNATRARIIIFATVMPLITCSDAPLYLRTHRLFNISPRVSLAVAIDMCGAYWRDNCCDGA